MPCSLWSPDQRRIQYLIYVIIPILYHLAELTCLLMSELRELNIRSSAYLILHIPYRLSMAGEIQPRACRAPDIGLIIFTCMSHHLRRFLILFCQVLRIRQSISTGRFPAIRRLPESKSFHQYSLCIIISLGYPLSHALRRKVKHSIYRTAQRNWWEDVYHIRIIVSVSPSLIKMNHHKLPVALIIKRLHRNIVPANEKSTVIIFRLIYGLHWKYDRYGGWGQEYALYILRFHPW